MFDTKTNTKTDPLGSGPVLLYCDYMEWEVLELKEDVVGTQLQFLSPTNGVATSTLTKASNLPPLQSLLFLRR